MRITSCAATDRGKMREHNEDAFKVAEKGEFFIVADGMGGHRAGEVASQMACDLIATALDHTTGSPAPQRLESALTFANERLFDHQLHHEQCRGMGTTLTALLIEEATGYIAQVGDSRAYLYRAGDLSQITRDHSLVAELVRSGELGAEEAFDHPQKNVLTKALGTDPQIKIDLFELELQDGDLILLCTDGLTNMIEDLALAGLLSAGIGDNLCEELIRRANQSGGRDNITVVLVKVEGDQDA